MPGAQPGVGDHRIAAPLRPRGDVMAVGILPRDLAAVARAIEEFSRGGIGIYPWGIHVDVRPDGPSRWGAW